MINFLRENWRWMLEIALVICSAVVFILRKKPVKVVDTLKEIICRLLPGLIAEAEKSGKSGDFKKSLVISGLKILLKEFGYQEEVIEQYMEFAGEQVEVILSTPQKKGVL